MVVRATLAATILASALVAARPGDAIETLARGSRTARVARSGPSSVYWTPQRMRGARPLPIPEAPPIAASPAEGAAGPASAPPGGSGAGAPPSVDVVDDPGDEAWRGEVWDGDDAEATIAGPARADQPSSIGTSGCPFSSSRLIPRTADERYPYRAVGKLFFTKPGIGDFVCSGSVLRPRVVLTAGHCVHSGNGLQSGFFTNFLFCPAFRGGPSKYGCWDWSFLAVTTDWFNSANMFPNAADYAMFEMADRTINGSPTRIADVTGFFGYLTSALVTNHVHLLGYPQGFSSGNRMHQVAAGRCTSGGSNTERYGSDMRGGSSGGPWVQDFGIPAAGQTVTHPSGPNLIVGITSYSNVSTDPKYQGSSIPDGRFQSLLDMVCAHRGGNC